MNLLKKFKSLWKTSPVARTLIIGIPMMVLALSLFIWSVVSLTGELQKLSCAEGWFTSKEACGEYYVEKAE